MVFPGGKAVITLGAPLVVALAALSSACEFPTDRSGELAVVLGDVPPLIVNDTITLSASVLLEGDTLPNVEVRFSADNQSVLSVSPDGRLLAVGAGDVTVTAEALTYQQATPGVETLRVRDEFELDSIAPLAARYGETVQLYGVGLSRTILAQLGGVDAIPASYAPADPEQRDRFGVLSLYATPPAPGLSQAVLIGFDGVLISDTVLVVRRDLYEQNDTIPRSLDAPMMNPALAFERVRRGDGKLAVDWYTFTTDAVDDWTISAWSPAGGARFRVYVTNSLYWSGALLDLEGIGLYAVGPGDWGVGTGFRPCGGLGLNFRGGDEAGFTFEVPPDSAVIPLGGLPAGTYHVFVTYGEGGPFYDATAKVAGVASFVDSLNLASPLRSGLEIRRGYKSLLPPDDLEENDYCDVAPSITVPGTVGPLTVDSPHDADWYRFRIDTPTPLKFSITTAGDFSEFADLDTYVVRDFRPDSLVVVDFGVGADVTNETAGVELEPGDYFLIVVDFLGVPTQYMLTSEVIQAVPSQVDPALLQVILNRKRKESDSRRIELRATAQGRYRR
jgi:hypothetical protein